MHTAAGLFAGSQSSTNCAFCNEKNHESKNCKLALNLDLQENNFAGQEEMLLSMFQDWTHGATLNHLLDGTPDCYKMTAQHLQKSMHVDNCVASVKKRGWLDKVYK
ncbi:hypothetical protein CEXT_376001 [Caerostris extrusa]|uniref:Uncharacterized protein n=1 Tax=Caerostris extrusa TaxID=172846 RepID=A0AAV4TJI8_CAEEX|nr:hypothetical protein CEXT_376001 [Caerostris extrusa]